EIENDLGVRLFGSPPAVIDCAQSKAATRAVMERAGVSIAKGALIAPGQDALAVADNIGLPLIVKPDSTDNSVGVSLVHEKDDLEGAIAEAQRHCDTIVMEAFIPGREIRAAVIERDDGLYCPAMIEYTVSDETPIRRFDDKLDTDADGRPIGKSTGSAIRTVCPASVGSALRQRIEDAAIAAHEALGARDFSLFDFRIDARTGEPVLLEACPYWSLSPKSIISEMATADGEDLEALALDVLNRAARAANKAANPKPDSRSPMRPVSISAPLGAAAI
ncbi:MAG: hypothetical protein AAFR33_10265, partial [Pseudomonadota bacterium]